MPPQINPLLFDWIIWRNGSPLDIFGLPLRNYTIHRIKPLINRYSIGYCNGEELVCRPKIGHKAVMFYKDEEYYWFHMTNEEFEKVFDK